MEVEEEWAESQQVHGIVGTVLTVLLCSVCVSARLLCSSVLMLRRPQKARACSQAMLISGTRTTSSHTWPTLH
ncbi:hypothetical protein EYF80_046767 [Liparis tanakae]|uniref:Uncharacterized protein n=1 Tax=Liparis tanakae TaxID=230148 RepID=A0A4Z2FPE5_9TELE|nr:hypothetical protein EYF80_046767 [Liparis tanakae]